ncbi:hypothetical protein [Streptomyces sp. NPDC003327]
MSDQTPEQMIATLRTDMTKADNELLGKIKERLDPKSFSFLLEEKDQQGKIPKTFKNYDEGLKAYVKKEIEAAGEMTWKPQIEWYKTPEFMGLVTGLTFLKLDLAIFDVTERVKRLALRAASGVRNWVANRWRPSWRGEWRTAAHKGELQFQQLETTVGRLRPLVMDSRKKLRLLDKRVEKLELRDRNVRQAVQNVPNDSSVTGTTNRITRLRAEVDLLRAALG